MTQNVHICPVGFYPEPILTAVGALPADKYVFILNDNEKCHQSLQIIESALLPLGQTNNRIVDVDPFDYGSVLSALMRIHHEEKEYDPDTKFYINITSGTNVVAAACSSVAYYIGATMYYVLMNNEEGTLTKSERIKTFHIPRIPDTDKMKPFAKDILLKICEKQHGIGMQALVEYMQSTPQKLNHHINAFLDSGLILKEKDGRNVVLKATEQGKMMASWIESRE